MVRGTRGSQPTLVRQRLIQRVVGAGAAPITVVQGAAGLGKSVLLSHIRSLARRRRVVTISSADELATHANSLADAAEPPADLVLIDDITGVDDLMRTALTATDRAATRIVVASRAPVPGVTSGMVLAGEAVVLAIEDLVFTEPEIAALSSRLKVRIEPEDAAELQRSTDGWPGMVHAALRAHGTGASITGRRLRELFDRFVRDELLSGIPVDDLAMLTDAAAVPRFDAPVLATLLSDRFGADTKAIQLIDRWATRGWVIHEQFDGHWRIPQPLRQSLLADLDVNHPGRREELATSAARMLVAAGRTTDALPYLVEASLDEVVAGVLRERWADDVAPHGQFVEAGPAVRKLDDSALASDASLLLISAVSALRAPPDLDTFALRLDQAEAVVDHDSFNGPLMTFHTLSMLLARSRGDIERAKAVERSGQAHIDAANDELRHQHVHRLVSFHFQAGMSRLAEGRLQEANATFRSSRSMARNNRGDWYVALNNEKLAYTSFLRGDLVAARQETEAVRSYTSARSDPLLTEHVNLLLGLLELEHGRTWDVPELLNRAQTMLDRDAEPPASWLAMAWSTLALLSDDPSSAEQALLLCGPEHATNLLPVNRLLATIARANARMVHDDPKAALSELDEAVPLPGHAATIAIARARAYLALDDPLAAARELAAHHNTDDPLPWTVRADLLALTAECGLRQEHDARPSFGRLLALLERTGARRPVLLLPYLREAVVGGRLSAPSSSPLARLDVEVAALMRCNEEGVPVLSDREREVLAALAGPETLTSIAQSMYVSNNTLKTVTRGLYRKLGAADRHEAVRVARAVGILP